MVRSHAGADFQHVAIAAAGKIGKRGQIGLEKIPLRRFRCQAFALVVADCPELSCGGFLLEFANRRFFGVIRHVEPSYTVVPAGKFSPGPHIFRNLTQIIRHRLLKKPALPCAA
jgi:hypothetical protein